MERSLRANSGTAFVLAMATAVVVNSAVSAHRRDELLQAARIAIEPGRVELALDLTPGMGVAEAIIAELDCNQDAWLSPDETSAFVHRVLAAIELDIDGQPLQVTPVASTFPDLDTFRRGEGTIHVQSVANVPRLSNGNHYLTFRNMHRRDVSVYLANALVPETGRISITAQRRDGNQRDLTIDYVLRESTLLTPVSLLSGIAGALAALFMRRSRAA
jgi:hypothetical protein